MADSFIQVPVDSTGKLVDCEQLTVGANTVQRERHEIVGASASEVARVVNSQPAGTEYGLVVREAQKGQATMANSHPVAIASDQTVIPVSDNSGSLTVDGTVSVSGAVDTELTTADLDTGAGTDTRAVIGLVYGASGGGVLVSTTNPLPIGDNAGSITVDGTVSITANSAVNVAQINGVTPLMGNGTTGTGSQRVTIASDNTAFTVNAAQSGTWTVGSSTATGSAVPANAFYKGGIAKTALPTAASDGNLTGAMVDKYGRQVCLIGSIRDLTGTQTTTLSATTTETTIVTQAANIFNDLVMLIVSNTSASTNTRIDFRDTTAGTVLFSLFSVGGAAPVGFALPVPIPQTTVNTNWTAQCATSTTDIRIYAVFVKNK
jgi:hypothetical protein